jgi:hypothetical protein
VLESGAGARAATRHLLEQTLSTSARTD